MSRTIRLIAALFAALAAQPSHGAAVSPGVTITVDGASRFVDASPFVEHGKTLYGIADASPIGLVAATMDPDPFINASLVITDFGAGSTFDFLYVLPIVPATGPVRLHLAIGVTCTDVGDNGCFAFPSLASGFFAEGSLDGTSLVFGGGIASGPPGGSGGYPTLTFAVDLPAVFTYTALDLHIGFSGSGGGDVYGISARSDLELLAVPLPATLALASAALVALAGVAGATRRKSLPSPARP